MFKTLEKLIKKVGRYSFLSFLFLGLSSLLVFMFFQELHKTKDLSNYEPPLVTRIYDKELQKISELSWEKRHFAPLHKIPKQLREAFISAEDKNFYAHFGIDVLSLCRAVIENSIKKNWAKRPAGASTITQQVAKNMIVGNKNSLERKIEEALSSFLIEYTLTKDEILEIYLNEIYLGRKTYGVLAAAEAYFGKPLEKLSIAECAYLASLPKAPSSYDPVKYKKKAIERRNWVIGRLYEDGYITKAEATSALKETLECISVQDTSIYDYFSEQVRRELLEQFGEDVLYSEGLSVFTTQDAHLQALAENILKEGLLSLDKERGYRGPITHLDLKQMPQTKLEWEKSDLKDSLNIIHAGPKNWKPAIVLTNNNPALIGVQDGRVLKLPLKNLFRSFASTNDPKDVRDVLEVGDIILIEEKGDVAYLQQIPDLTGAIIVMHPDTGAVLALAGGFDAYSNHFNAATQALRQVGSCFKPFVYLCGLEKGYTGNTIIEDKPINIYLGPGLGYYTPQNISKVSYGPTPMRIGIEKSRNQMTVQLAQQVGMAAVSEMGMRFGLYDKEHLEFSLSLGAIETTVLQLTAAYAMIANGGKKIKSHFITLVQDRLGKILKQNDSGISSVYDDEDKISKLDGSKISFYDNREEIIAPVHAAAMSDFLKGVITKGTGIGLLSTVQARGIDFCGKTGTTNDCKDAWMVGYTRNLGAKNVVVGIFIGYAIPKSMGSFATGSKIALPFMRNFLKKMPL